MEIRNFGSQAINPNALWQKRVAMCVILPIIILASVALMCLRGLDLILCRVLVAIFSYTLGCSMVMVGIAAVLTMPSDPKIPENQYVLGIYLLSGLMFIIVRFLTNLYLKGRLAPIPAIDEQG